ncbi:hypothetical protein D9M68_602470 [compost metagenome]
MRVLDVLEVHTPELGPAPRTFQEDAGDAPQRVSAYDGVAVGGIGGQFGQRHTRLGDLVGRRPLPGGDGKVLRPGTAADQRGEKDSGPGQRMQAMRRTVLDGRTGVQWHVWAPGADAIASEVRRGRDRGETALFILTSRI